MFKFKKSKIFLSSLAIGITVFASSAYAQSVVYTVKPGDSMWKIASKYQVGVSELIAANPSIKNPNVIYPNQKITIPTIDDVKAFEKEVVRLTNVERAKYGLKPLTENWELSRVAWFKSQDMIDKKYFDHTSPTYGSPFTMMKNFGIKYTAAGENIAYGQKTPQEVVNAWMNSPGHRANILNTNYTQIGVGFAKNSSGTPYWTQMFINPGK